ncbi:MAG: hypothetical protein B5M53_04890 [Candidatus Cloacimonas sp. 4484_209]|nr:MAG: hypothetical protein B5M53_04890 [Candidatus Cloacimonas sp. 4484_209]
MPLMSETVGRRGAYSLLNKIYAKSDIVNPIEILSLMEEIGVSDELFSELAKSGLFIESPDGFYISSLGKKVTLLLRAINDEEEISEVFQQLTYIYPSLRPYELITENITDYFIDSLYTRPDFIRVYICSPWIRLDENHIEKIKNAIFTASKRYTNLQVLIITLPLERYRDKKATETLKALKQIGAEIVSNSRLHAKLYISEPGPAGGNHYAIFGSENLTGRKNIELAIKIQNDNEILRKLNLYFHEIWQESQILMEV